MVVTVAWTNSWLAVSIALGVLLILVLFLLGCLCYDRERRASARQFYVLDEGGLKRVPDESGAENGFFRRLSAAGGVLRPHFRFSGAKSDASRHPLKQGERELMDSLDFDGQFSASVLQIEARDRPTYLDADDWKSCASEASHHRNSAESVRSAVSDPGFIIVK